MRRGEVCCHVLLELICKSIGWFTSVPGFNLPSLLDNVTSTLDAHFHVDQVNQTHLTGECAITVWPGALAFTPWSVSIMIRRVKCLKTMRDNRTKELESVEKWCSIQHDSPIGYMREEVSGLWHKQKVPSVLEIIVSLLPWRFYCDVDLYFFRWHTSYCEIWHSPHLVSPL